MPKYIVTFSQNFYANQPIEVEAENYLQSLGGLGLTVWEKEKWDSLDHKAMNAWFKTKEPIDVALSSQQYREELFNNYVKEHPLAEIQEYNGNKYVVMGDNSAETNS